jgi:hypothetical protein
LRRFTWLWLALFSGVSFLFLSTGCGSSASDAQLRFLQASPDAPRVNVLVDGVSVAGNLAYGNATGYITVKAGSRRVQVVPVSGASPIFNQTISLTASTNQTLLFTGPAASIQAVMLTDGVASATAPVGDGYVRVLNASATMGAADVYLVPAGSSIVGVQPVTSGLAFDKDTGYKFTVAGDFEVFLTAPGTANAFLSTGSVSLTAAQYQTVVALDGASGGFSYALLTDQ